MNTPLRYAAPDRRPERPSLALRLCRALFLLGVWVLVGLAGLAAWSRLT